MVDMKLYVCMFFCAIGLCCGSGVSAESPGSSSAKIQKNFDILITTKSCPRCDLSGVVLTRVDLTGADLEGANLAGAKLTLANLTKANLSNANLQGADLGGADFAGADLRGADLTRALLGGAYLKEALLDRPLGKDKHISQVQRKRLAPGTSKKLSPISEIVVANAQAAPRSASNQALDAIPVIESDFHENKGKLDKEENLDFWDTLTSLFDTEETERKRVVEKVPEKIVERPQTPVVQHPISKITADRPRKIAKQSAQQISLTRFQRKSSAGKETGAVRTYTVETAAQAAAKQLVLINRLLEKNRCVACDLAGADLAGKNFDSADLERADLRGANLEGADLNGANLKGTNFNSANLKGADLRESDLYLADFTNANLTGTRLEGALIDSADFSGTVGLNLDGAVQEE